MNQYQQDPYDGPQNLDAQLPRRTSKMAITALVLSIIGLIPCIGICTTPFGILFGLISTITATGAKKGRGIAVAAVIIGLLGAGVQYMFVKWAINQAIIPVMEGPNEALHAGFDGDLAGFRAATHSPAADASDEEILAFIETLRSRYGDIVSVQMDQQAQGQQQQPAMGSTAAYFPYVYTFKDSVIRGETEIVFADEVTGKFVMKPSVIVIEDPDLGDITFPPSATGGSSGSSSNTQPDADSADAADTADDATGNADENGANGG